MIQAREKSEDLQLKLGNELERDTEGQVQTAAARACSSKIMVRAGEEVGAS